MEEYRSFLVSQTYATLFSAMNKIKTLGDQAVGELTSRQLMLFIAILHLPNEETTLSSIARKLGSTKQSTAQLVESLKKQGYLETEPSTTDKRALNIKITEKAKPIFVACDKKGWKFLEDLFHEFTTEELELFWQMLKKLYRFNGNHQSGFEEDRREL